MVLFVILVAVCFGGFGLVVADIGPAALGLAIEIVAGVAAIVTFVTRPRGHR
jgi:hypothetical protein